MEFGSLYRFSDAGIRGALHVESRKDHDEIALSLGKKRPRKPLVFTHHSGGKPRDVIGTTEMLCLVSERVIKVLRENEFTGWTTYPVEIHGKGGSLVEGYHGFAVTGRCGPIDWCRGKKVRRPPRVPGGKPCNVWIGMYFDPDSWDGSDVFVPKDTLYTIVTEEVKSAVEGIKPTNVEFEPLTQFERSWPL